MPYPDPEKTRLDAYGAIYSNRTDQNGQSSTDRSTNSEIPNNQTTPRQLQSNHLVHNAWHATSQARLASARSHNDLLFAQIGDPGPSRVQSSNSSSISKKSSIPNSGSQGSRLIPSLTSDFTSPTTVYSSDAVEDTRTVTSSNGSVRVSQRKAEQWDAARPFIEAKYPNFTAEVILKYLNSRPDFDGT